MHTSDEQLCLLTNSPGSAIRWRLKDYEQILRAEIDLLIALDGRQAHPLRGSQRSAGEAGAPR